MTVENPFVDFEVKRLGLNFSGLPVLLPKFFGQCAEDYLVASLLRALSDREHLNLTDEFYCEIGANNPVSTNSTYLLYTQLGMTGVLVEANPYLIEQLKYVRSKDTIVNAAVVPFESHNKVVKFYISSFSELSSLKAEHIINFQHVQAEIKEETEVSCLSLIDVLSNPKFSKAPIFLSIDIEGLDCALITNFCFSVRPFIIQIEAAPENNVDEYLEIVDVLQKNDYNIIMRTDVNQIAIDVRRFGLR